jgi:hypothetical protein
VIVPAWHNSLPLAGQAATIGPVLSRRLDSCIGKGYRRTAVALCETFLGFGDWRIMERFQCQPAASTGTTA